MNIKNISYAKVSLGIFVLLNGAIGLVQVLDPMASAKNSWGAANVLAHDELYEKLWGMHIILFSTVGLILLLATEGKSQAKATAYLGGLSMVFFIVLSSATTLFALGDFVIPLILFGVLPIVAGVLDLKKIK